MAARGWGAAGLRRMLEAGSEEHAAAAAAFEGRMGPEDNAPPPKAEAQVALEAGAYTLPLFRST